MNIYLNKTQRTVLFLFACIIIFVQILVFEDRGFRGYGWIFSFLIAGVLIVIAFSKNKPTEPQEKQKKEPLSKTELESIHEQHRANGEALSLEIRQRAKELYESLKVQYDPQVTEIIFRGKREAAEKFDEDITSFWREYCVLLMLGLVAMRRAESNQLYISSLEFRTMQNSVSKLITELAVKRLASMVGPKEIDYKHLSERQSEEFLTIRKHVVNYSLCKQKGLGFPEKPLLDWFEGKTGFRGLGGKEEIADALSPR